MMKKHKPWLTIE